MYYEVVNADVGTGTIILNAPSGFVFDTGGTAPTVRIDPLSGTGKSVNNINNLASGTSAAIASRTSTQIRFDVSSISSGGIACSLTWQNIRVRPVVASPLANGDITKTGTSTMAAVSGNTSFGKLTEINALALASLQFTQPTRLTGIVGAPDGIKITFTGSAGYTYQIQRAAALQYGNIAWEAVGSATTDNAGHGEFTDPNSTSAQSYYRAVRVEQSRGGPLVR